MNDLRIALENRYWSLNARTVSGPNLVVGQAKSEIGDRKSDRKEKLAGYGRSGLKRTTSRSAMEFYGRGLVRQESGVKKARAKTQKTRRFFVDADAGEAKIIGKALVLLPLRHTTY
jgi:hypothetical protein